MTIFVHRAQPDGRIGRPPRAEPGRSGWWPLRVDADIPEGAVASRACLFRPARPGVRAVVLRLYRAATGSPARAADLLFDAWAEENLPVLPPAPEDAIQGLIH